MIGKRCVLLAVLFCCGPSYASAPEVELDGGLIRGSLMKSERNRTILAFRGIPYAEPPNRFQPPEPKKPWSKNTVIDASKDGPECYQVDFIMKTMSGQEDCLYLNVYTLDVPKDPSKADLKAVMFYIHGGSFALGTGSSDFYGPGRLLDTGIVLVAINYRLGSLGFLSTGDSSSPGNYGLLDQLEALKWTKKNIHRFGGDPDNITIFGNSAGGASVIYHMLSPLSKGLFQAAIAMSGSPLCSWGFQYRPKYWNNKLGEKIGCSSEESSAFVECLKSKSAEDIVRNGDFIEHSFIPAAFGPTVDNHFLPDTPENLMNAGKIQRVPFMIGITAEEGTLNLAMIAAKDPSKTTFYKTEILDLLKPMINADSNEEKTAKFVRKMYFKDVDYSNDNQVRKALTKAFSDGLFRTCHYQTVKLLSDAGMEIYVYSYDYATKYSFTDYFDYKYYLGVGHMDELYTVFDGPVFGKPNLSQQDEKIGRATRALLTHFAKVKSPTPDHTKSTVLDWTPATIGKIPVYHINDPITVDEFDSSDHEWYKWWDQFVPEIMGKKKPGLNKDEL